ncbi:MAG TPA: hypothetical protein VIL16_25580 [Trebonia sp.]
MPAEPDTAGRPGEATIPPRSEVSGGPDTPLEIGAAGWRNTLKRTGKNFVRDRCSMTAGSLAYHWFLDHRRSDRGLERLRRHGGA